MGGTARSGGYTDRAGIDSRANSAGLEIARISAMYHVPSAVRLVWIAERMQQEPILTDESPAAYGVRRLAAQIKAKTSAASQACGTKAETGELFDANPYRRNP